MNEDIQKQILEEMKKQTAMFKKTNIIIAVIFISLFLFMAFIPKLYEATHSPNVSCQVADSWEGARNLIDKGEFDKANEMLDRLIKKFPNYYYGYSLLGFSHQVKGDLKESELNYAKAYNLFPIDENEKALKAIRTVLNKKKQ